MLGSLCSRREDGNASIHDQIVEAQPAYVTLDRDVATNKSNVESDVMHTVNAVAISQGLMNFPKGPIVNIQNIVKDPDTLAEQDDLVGVFVLSVDATGTCGPSGELNWRTGKSLTSGCCAHNVHVEMCTVQVVDSDAHNVHVETCTLRPSDSAGVGRCHGESIYFLQSMYVYIYTCVGTCIDVVVLFVYGFTLYVFACARVCDSPHLRAHLYISMYVCIHIYIYICVCV